MMQVTIRFAGIRRVPDGAALEARCQAASCRAQPRAWSGDPDWVISAVGEHVREHLEEYIEIEKWIRGERAGARVVHP